MKLKKIISLVQNPHGLDMSAVLVCEYCLAIQHYRQTTPDRDAHLAAIEQVPCTVCVSNATACQTCED